jgi:hypothetical protein
VQSNFQQIRGEKTMKNLVMISIFALFLTACGGAGLSTSTAPAKLNVKFPMMGKDVVKDVDLKDGVVTTRTIKPTDKSTLDIPTYEIHLANFEIDSAKLSDAFPKKDGDVRVTIQILGDKDATDKTPVKEGTYNASQVADGENVYGKAWHVLIRYFEEGKVKETSLTANYPKGARKGQVKINSVKDGKLSGEIDMSDDQISVKGVFNAVLPKN